MENFKKGTKENINPSVKKSTGKGTFYLNFGGREFKANIVERDVQAEFPTIRAWSGKDLVEVEFLAPPDTLLKMKFVDGAPPYISVRLDSTQYYSKSGTLIIKVDSQDKLNHIDGAFDCLATDGTEMFGLFKFHETE
ncbi:MULTISPECIES: hypothetical protein [Pseudomonas]|uniref:hypothetical protein n=1 Tax=Pseudomonas TaxID=286 RepID=UPI001F2468B0|nr:hypothetical protein [Pseudomonas sputi]